MKHISPLICVGTVFSKPTAAMAKWGRDSKSKANKVSLCDRYIILCKLLLAASWKKIQWQGTLLLLQIHWHHKEHLCAVMTCLATANGPFSLHSHEMVSEQWNTCGPEWHNNDFVSLGNDVFPDLGNTTLRLEQGTGNWEDKHPLFYSCSATLYTQSIRYRIKHSYKRKTVHVTKPLYLAGKWDLADHNCKNMLFIYTSS